MRKVLLLLFTIILTGRVSASSAAEVSQSPSPFWLYLALLSPFIASALIAAFYRYFGDRSAYLGAFSGLISFLSVLMLYGSEGVVSSSWVPSLGFSAEFYVDGLSLMMAFLASGIGMLVFIYSHRYMVHESWKHKYYAVLTAFMGSMMGLVFSSNLIVLFMFWEFTSICSFLLISHNQRKDGGIRSSKKSLLLTVGSGLLLLIGIILLGETAGTYSIAEMLNQENLLQTIKSQGLYLPILALTGVGAAAKSAQVPFHIWLPDAMEAPTPVSAFLHSATMVKAGVYLIGRFRPMLMQGELWSLIFVTAGLVTMTLAAILAVGAEELKELLAYSTASHLGLIVAGFGFTSVLGAETASFHIFNHAIFKASLFMVAGIVLHEAGTQRIEKLSGLGKRWPLLAAITTLSGLSMAGIPPLNGFYSKELLFESVYHLASHSGGFTWFLPAIAVTGSVFTFIYSLRFISVFYGGECTVEAHDVPRSFLIAPGVLAFLALFVGISPNYFIHLVVEPALNGVSAEFHSMSIGLPDSLRPSLVMSLITIGTGAVIFSKVEMVHGEVRKFLKLYFIEPNYYYDRGLDLLNVSSDYLVKKIETSLLRTYVIWVLIVSSFVGLLGYVVSGGVFTMNISSSLPVLIVLATSVASVYAVVRSREYVSMVLTLSILGFMVSIFYLLMDAPDLVLTQLVVETLTLIIFLLVLKKLPELQKKVSYTREAEDLIISAAAGLMIFISVLYSTAEKTPAETARYYVENAIPGSGGGNVVNVMLVDFRGIDTMGEISVIAMAALTIYMLFKMRGEGQ